MGVDLEYVGGGRYVVGWPACDHHEPDDEIARQKLASGLYRPKGEGAEAGAGRPEGRGKGGGR